MLVDESMNGQLVELTVGESVEIRLAENRTAGYQWNIVSEGKPVCALIGDTSEAATGPPGKGGSHRWELEATQPGEALVTIEYRRPWERDVATAQRFSLRIRVSPTT